MFPKEMWLRKAVKIVQKNPSPDRIPLTGDERLKQRDYFYAGLDGIDPEGDVLIAGLSQTGVLGRPWHDDRYQSDAVDISMARAAKAKPTFVYYLRRFEFIERDPFRFWLKVRTRYYRRVARREERRESRFNRRQLERKERMDVLQAIVRLSMDKDGRTIDAVMIATLLYQRGWIRHPAADEVLQRIRALVRVLVAEGLVEVAQPNTAYRMLPDAVRVLDQYSTEERRHADSQALQRKVMILGGVAAFATLVQAAANVKQAWFEKPASEAPAVHSRDDGTAAAARSSPVATALIRGVQ
ncbi:hypothetical protein PFF91_37455 [Burkholderia cenocepacia]|uniref:hypothetical protein n=2 Tax=Burkholderia cenocepacia TaxID=95486 RepID=UPI0022EB9287|nr:hypothetical protein [Burkholderia cenocepacia]MDA3672380.1 hypothetical protein [Burkholderia cenocepacia]MDA3681930.1 hypothetical protein [Burkholderia cenocepacia]MDA3696700.1 hypothetical protein [Burkholderia cenocepacia]MDA3704044.1 hypothetical protein [Burkholderia cenocepacia]MDA3711343.1 hypothetical protein [Burkholderia cenocepacia]